MKKHVLVLLLVTHVVAGGLGFGLGIYALPILIAPPAPTEAEIISQSEGAMYTSVFKENLAGSDVLHWGEGTVSVGPKFVTLMGSLAPGPDYKLYLSPEFVETEAEFNQIKSTMVRVGDVKTFENFSVPVPTEIDVAQYNAVVVWCETFGEFITAAKYK